MILEKLQFEVLPDQNGLRLDDFLLLRLSEFFEKPVARSRVRALILSGSVYINRRKDRVIAKAVKTGQLVQAFVSEEKLFEVGASGANDEWLLEEKNILFEDEFLICIDKSAGIPTQPTIDPKRPNLYQSVTRFLIKRDKVGDPYLGLHHRLDRDTSGCVLFTKSKAANPGVSKLFVEHLIQKTYLAITVPNETHVENAFEVRNYLGPDPRSLKIKKFRSVRSGGEPAHTLFQVLDRASAAWLIQAEPRTGRTHQIRVHLSEHGFPILGDPTYSDDFTAKRAPRTMLHAWRLEFEHPITHANVLIEAPLPADFKETLSLNDLMLG